MRKMVGVLAGVYWKMQSPDAHCATAASTETETACDMASRAKVVEGRVRQTTRVAVGV